MKLRYHVKRFRFLALTAALVLSVVPAFSQKSKESTLNQATLFSRLGHQYQGYGPSAYNFYAKARSDNWPGIVRNRAHLMFGSINFVRRSNCCALPIDDHDPLAINGLGGDEDTNWFSVSAGGPELTRIKDLGPMQWSDTLATPFVPVTPHAIPGIRPPKAEESFEQSSEGRVTKVVAGHMYVIHIKGPQEDFYVMLRVEELVPNDRCTFSWKIVPPPDDKGN